MRLLVVHKRCHVATAGLALFILLAAAPTSAQVTFQDGTFNSADWDITTVFTSGNGGSGSAGQVGAGGNPGSYRSVTHNMGANPAKLYLFHRRAGATHDPQTQGPILGISFSFDAKTFNDAFAYGGQSASLGLRQNGITYAGPYFANALPNPWTGTTQTNLLATDFDQVEGTANPNFSVTGTTIELGLITSNHNPPGGAPASSTIVGYDNWMVEIEHAIPAPSFSTTGTLAFGAMVLAAGFWMLRHRYGASRTSLRTGPRS
jgi:hypothetical protein